MRAPGVPSPLPVQGEYQDDLPHGFGIYLFSSGQMYEGEWALGKKHGWSIYTVDNGERGSGPWAGSTEGRMPAP